MRIDLRKGLLHLLALKTEVRPGMFGANTNQLQLSIKGNLR